MNHLTVAEATVLLNEDGYTCGTKANLLLALRDMDIEMFESDDGPTFESSNMDLIRERFDTKVVVSFDGTEVGADGKSKFDADVQRLADAAESGQRIRVWMLRRLLSTMHKLYADSLSISARHITEVGGVQVWVMVADDAESRQENTSRVTECERKPLP